MILTLIPPEESVLSIAMPLVNCFLIVLSTRRWTFEDCGWSISMETTTCPSSSVRVFSSADPKCDVSVILGDCDWMAQEFWTAENGWSFSSSSYCLFFVSVGGHGIVISGWCLTCTWEVHFGSVVNCEENKKDGNFFIATMSQNLHWLYVEHSSFYRSTLL